MGCEVVGWGVVVEEGVQMNNPHILCACRLSVTVWQREWHWRQGKTAFPVFIHPPLEAFESRMNNKWAHDDGGSQSRNMARLKTNGGVEKPFVLFIILAESKGEKRISRSSSNNVGKEESGKNGLCEEVRNPEKAFCPQNPMKNEARSHDRPFSILPRTTKPQSGLARETVVGWEKL